MSITVKQLIPKRSLDLIYALTHTEKTFIVILAGSSRYIREELALQMSREVLCTGTKDEDCPCASCRQGHENPDILVLKPSAAGNLLTGATQSCLDFLVEAPVRSDRKCVVMFDVDSLTPAALGNLLKLLEEDLSFASIIMTASSRTSVPDTLRSRSRVIFSGDNAKRSSFLRLMEEGERAKVAEELSALSSFSTLDCIADKETILAAYKVVAGLLNDTLQGKTTNALQKYLKFAGNSTAVGIQALIEECAATLTDIQKVRFTAASHVTQPSRLEWFMDIKDKVSEGLVDQATEAFMRVLACPQSQWRAMAVWAITGVSVAAASEAK